MSFHNTPIRLEKDKHRKTLHLPSLVGITEADATSSNMCAVVNQLIYNCFVDTLGHQREASLAPVVSLV